MDGALILAAVKKDGAAAGSIIRFAGYQLLVKANLSGERLSQAENLCCIPFPALAGAGGVANVSGIFLQIFIEVMQHLNHSHHLVV